MELKHISNDELFTRYEADLILRINHKKNLKNIINFLGRFKEYLGSFPPSPELAKGFLGQFKPLKQHTFYNYVGELKRFMAWYGEPVDLKAKLPKSLPPYHEDRDIEALLAIIKCKQSHKKMIPRDQLLVELALKTGLRRAELANLEPRDVHSDFLVVRRGKGSKDRIIPLLSDIALKLHNFIKGMPPTQKIFGLNPTSLGMKIKDLAKRAGLTDLHCHSLRHRYALDLLEKGVDIRVLQQLLGHENLNTTQVYLAVTDKRLREAVNKLEEPSSAKQLNDEIKLDGRKWRVVAPSSVEDVPIPPRR